MFENIFSVIALWNELPIDTDFTLVLLSAYLLVLI